jgi:hypothetical protein
MKGTALGFPPRYREKVTRLPFQMRAFRSALRPDRGCDRRRRKVRAESRGRQGGTLVIDPALKQWHLGRR